MTTLIPKFDFKNGGSTPTGAVNRPINLKLGEWTSPEDFGAVGDGITDDTVAIQAALNTGKNVIFPSNNYLISAPLNVLFGQRVIGQGVSTNGLGTFDMTTITVSGNIACFTCVPTTANVTFEIDGFCVLYSGTMPTTPTGNSGKIAFSFTQAIGQPGPQLCRIANCLVLGAWKAFYQNGGMYLTKIERFFAYACYFGFQNIGGTTIEFDTCYVLQGCAPWNIQTTPGVTITNSGFDSCNITADSPGNALFSLSSVDNFVIDTMSCESNNVKTDFGSAFLIYSSIGVFNGLAVYNTTLQNQTSGKDVYQILIQSSWVSFNGCNPVRGPGTLIYTGANGFPTTIAATNYSFVNISSSYVRASTGGTPSANYSLSKDSTSLATYETSSFEASNTAYPTAWQQLGSVTPVLNGFTVTGTPILTGNYRATKTITGGTATVTIQINPNGGTVASVAGTSNITGLAFLPAIGTPVTVWNNFVAVNSGFVNTSGQIYLPTITATSSPIYVTFTYNI